MKRIRVDAVSAVLIMCVAVGYIVATSAISEPSSYSVVGPKTFPIMIGALMLLSGIWLLIESRTQVSKEPATGSEHGGTSGSGEAKPDWRTVAIVAGCLVGYILVLELAGFVVSTISLIYLTATCMGSKHHIRDALVAVTAGVIFFVIFRYVFELRIPTTPLGF